MQADVRDPEAMRRAAAGVDAVIHTAYVQGDGEWEANVDGSAAVAEAARGLRLVHLSSDLVFAGTRGRYREEDAAGAGELLRALEGRGGAQGRRAARRRDDRAHVADLRRRPSPARRSGSRAEGTRFFVDEIRSPVQVGDLAEALLELLGLDAPGPLHLGRRRRRLPLRLRGAARRRPRASRARADDARPGAGRLARQLAGGGAPAHAAARRLRGAVGLSPALGRCPALGRAQEVLERHVQQRRLALGERLVAVGDRPRRCAGAGRAPRRAWPGSGTRC